MSSKKYCICNKEYEEGQFMIECGKCNEWFHGSCIGIEEYQAQDIDIYHCPQCQTSHGPLVYSFVDVSYANGMITHLKKRRNVSRHNYKEIHEGTKQITAGTVQFVRQLKVKKFLNCTPVVTFLEDGHTLDIEYLHTHGFKQPILVRDKKGLGLVVPPSNFTIYDVEKAVGALFDLHVIDVARQEDLRMKMREWTEYYNSPIRGKVLNVISLEFSNTSLSEMVVGPEVVRNMSWVENTWPKSPKSESTHLMPLVMKYCLMGVKDCYTDFHIDFGGTSVWYHVLRGEKVFYLVEPTKENMLKYQQWASSSDQSQVFFGDKVDKCYKAVISQGNTFFLPSGWIHAVLTPKDSLVFGGNFLNSFCIEKQLDVYRMEKQLSTPLKFLFPNFETSNWYAARTILRKIRDLHTSGLRLPDFLFTGVKCLITSLKQWCSKTDEYVKFHKLQVPLEVNSPSKLIKALEKELKLDEGTSFSSFSRSAPSPALMSANDGSTILRFKLSKNNAKEPEGCTTKMETEQTACSSVSQKKGGLSSIKLSLSDSGDTVRVGRLRKLSDEEEKLSAETNNGEDAKKNELEKIRIQIADGKIIVPVKEEAHSTIKLKLSLPTTSSSSSSSTSTTLEERDEQPIAKVDIKAEIEAATRDLFDSPLKNSLYFSTRIASEENDCTKKPINISMKKSSTGKKKKTLNSPPDDQDEINEGYVIDELPQTKKPLKREHGSGSDYAPSTSEKDDDDEDDNYYQDENFVYPRVDVTSALTQDDFSWKPGQRKHKPPTKKKARSTSQNSSKFFPSDEEGEEEEEEEEEKIKKEEIQKRQKERAEASKPPLPRDNKSKKGLKTAKQRLGKLLNLHKTGSRYVR